MEAAPLAGCLPRSAGVAPEDGRRPRSRSDVICDQPVLSRRHRGALVHRPIRPSGQRAASYLKAKGTSATYAEHSRLGGFREVPSVDRGSACSAPSTAEWPCLLRSHPPPPYTVARLSTGWREWRTSPAGDYARSDSANCSRADATLQLHASSSGCSDKTVVSFGSVIEPRRELCSRTSSGR
jgi:hypothetical protein